MARTYHGPSLRPFACAVCNRLSCRPCLYDPMGIAELACGDEFRGRVRWKCGTQCPSVNKRDPVRFHHEGRLSQMVRAGGGRDRHPQARALARRANAPHCTDFSEEVEAGALRIPAQNALKPCPTVHRVIACQLPSGLEGMMFGECRLFVVCPPHEDVSKTKMKKRKASMRMFILTQMFVQPLHPSSERLWRSMSRAGLS